MKKNRRDFIMTAVAGSASAALIGVVPASLARAEKIGALHPSNREFTAIDFATVKPSILAWPSERAVREHLKLYNGYVKKSNEIFGKLGALVPDPKQANQVYSEIRELKLELSFAVGGVKNHEIFFSTLGGDGTPTGTIAEEIRGAFGSIEEWMKDLKATAIASRGWSWLAYDHDTKSLFNYLGDAQNTFPVWNATALLALDVYEHAYWMDFGADRGKYIDEWFAHLDWKAAEERFLSMSRK